MNTPTFPDILAAQKRISPYLARTPLHTYPAINDLIGTSVYIKHENYHPVGAFKVRGGINLIAQLPDSERERGVITASTGNHGQSIAYAARLFNVTARIVVPIGANPGKVAAMQGMGATLIFHGQNFDEARLHCETLAREHGYRYIHSGDEPHLIAGVATLTLEMLQDQPDLEVIIVPIGGGSSAAGACLAANAVNPAIQVIGVQSESSPAAYETWRQNKPIVAPNRTFADGLATGTPFALPQTIMHALLKDFVLVTDEQILQSMKWMIEKAHTLAEPAGAASLAAAYNLRSTLKNKKTGIVCSGGNISLEHLKKALTLP